MANPPKPLYWDTDVFIHRFQRTPEHISTLEQITDAAERGEIVFVQSTFTISELVKDPDGEKLTEAQENVIEDFFENEFVIVRTLTEQIAFLSRKIAREHGLKPGDAVHVATAIFWKVPILHTYDDKLLKRDGLIGDPPLKIEKPSFVGQQNLLMEWIEGKEAVKGEENTNGAATTVEPPVARLPTIPEINQALALSPKEGSGPAGANTAEGEAREE
jgi:predicted nucleic acid-binding protein